MKQGLLEAAKWLQFRDLFLKDKELRCHYCNKKLKSDAPIAPKNLKCHVFRRLRIPKRLVATVDHVIPLSKGGEKFEESNLVICCNRCNGKKANKLLSEWKSI